MGNRANIVIPGASHYIYVHWNGGWDSVRCFLDYAKILNLRQPTPPRYSELDEHSVLSMRDEMDSAVVRLYGVIEAFLGHSAYLECWRPDMLTHTHGDNGTYVVGTDWDVVSRIYPYEGFREQDAYKWAEMMMDLSAAQPASKRLPEGFKPVSVVRASEAGEGALVAVMGDGAIQSSAAGTLTQGKWGEWKVKVESDKYMRSLPMDDPWVCVVEPA